MKLSNRFLGFVFSLLLISISTLGATSGATSEASDRYPREEERAALLNAINLLQAQKLQINFVSQTSPQAVSFLSIFKNEFWPVSLKLGALDEKASLLYVGVDRALYNDAAEKKQWNDQVLQLESEMNGIRSSKEYQDLIKRMSEAAQGLEGELADFARKAYKHQLQSAFTEAELPFQNRLTELQQKIKTIANEAPVSKHLAESEREAIAIEKRRLNGEISFAEATSAIEALRARSGAALGQYVAQNARELLAEAAIIRTKLAQTKGFKNWAEYQTSANEHLYKSGYKTAADRIPFLRELLASTKSAHKAFLEQRAKEVPGVPQELIQDIFKLRPSQQSFFSLPTEALISEYFPVENVQEVWRQTMRQSGFSPTAVERINLDSYPRENKQTHAYMLTARSHQPETFIVDGRTMKVTVPRQLPNRWMPAMIYIVQNMRADGINAYSTGFHEGGHALDYSHRQDVLGKGQDSSYSETHSMTMELFFSDRDFLLSLGKTREGKSIPPEKVDEYIGNSGLNNLASLRGQSLNALFDLELWNHAYVEGGEDFVSRAARLNRELTKEYMFALNGQVVDGIDNAYRMFSTDHFYGGQVRYIGYIYAEMAAKMTYDRLLDILEETTGRRTLLNQPSLAKLLIDGYYKRGFGEPFPGATESFVRSKFDATAAARKFDQSIQLWISSRNAIRTCESIFITSGN